MKGRPDSTALLEEIACPALVVAAAADSLMPAAEAELMRDRLPHARLVTISGAGHLVNLEAPDEFSNALATFLTADL
jgi:pimeloyl-ACP methyl ester carboxylesterase